MNLNAAVECAVDECIREGILEEFLRTNRAEVIAMSIFEYNKEEEDKKLRKAEFEAGYDTGYNTGYGSGFDAGIENKAKETAILLWEEGDSIEKIAKVLQVEKGIVHKWITEYNEKKERIPGDGERIKSENRNSRRYRLILAQIGTSKVSRCTELC